MIVVKIVGGIGNQMFQYALFRNLLEQGKDVYYDSLQTTEHNGFELENVFNIEKRPINSIKEIENLTVIGDTTWPRYNDKILQTKDNTYLEGNWQHINYFPDNNILYKDFSFKQKLDEKNTQLLEEIQNSNSVSIHVRRGDFLHDRLPHFFPTWLNYYGLAANYISTKSRERPLKFFVFSDDVNWCKTNFLLPMNYSENDKTGGWKDLYLMSQCKHNITTNSTFSWWGAKLNKNKDKIVITPKVWFYDYGNEIMNSILPKNWIRM